MVEQPTISCDEFLDRAAGVALDSGDADETRLIEDHAASHPECARQLQEFREVAAALGSAVAQVDPPEGVRSRLLHEARHTPQEKVKPVRPRRAWLRLRVSPAWLVAAASLVLSLVALTQVAVMQAQIVSLQSDAQSARERAARYDHVAQVLASEQLAVRPLQPMAQTVASHGMLYMDPLSGTGMVMCRNMPPLEQGRAYQVWFVRGNERISGGLVWPDRSGNGYALIQVPTDLQSFDSAGVTDEPGSGSDWPTTPRVLGTRLKESAQ